MAPFAIKVSITFMTKQASKSVNQLKYHTDKRSDTENEVLSATAATDIIAIEEPLLIVLYYFDNKVNSYQHTNLTLMMRTPDYDRQLVIGLLFAEGIIDNVAQIKSIIASDRDANQVEVTLVQSVEFSQTQVTQALTAQTSCGLCGKNTLNALSLRPTKVIDETPGWLSAQSVTVFSQALNQHQPQFKQTGGVHGAAYINNGKWLSVFEDVGRHNAVDKLIGHLLEHQQLSQHGILLLSGRISFELMQKAIVAGIAVVIGLGAPSSLAISAAVQFNVTLIGFAKNEQFNVYHGNHRLRQ